MSCELETGVTVRTHLLADAVADGIEEGSGLSHLISAEVSVRVQGQGQGQGQRLGLGPEGRVQGEGQGQDQCQGQGLGVTV